MRRRRFMVWLGRLGGAFALMTCTPSPTVRQPSNPLAPKLGDAPPLPTEEPTWRCWIKPEIGWMGYQYVQALTPGGHTYAQTVLISVPTQMEETVVEEWDPVSGVWREVRRRVRKISIVGV